MTLDRSNCRSPVDITAGCRAWFQRFNKRKSFLSRRLLPIYRCCLPARGSAPYLPMQQLNARLSVRGKEQGSRVRARPAGVHASAHQRLGEVEGSHGLSPFQRQLESPLSPSGEDLTAGDILQEHGVSEEGGDGFDEGEGAEDGPLRSAELGMDHRINKQVRFLRAPLY